MAKTKISEPDAVQYAQFGRRIAALLGSNSDWSPGSDYLGSIGEIALRSLGVGIGDQDQEQLRFWRRIADEYGFDHDGDGTFDGIDWDEAERLARAFREAAEGDSGDAEIDAAVEMADFLESVAELAKDDGR
jgi:hypothetical protein